MSQFNQKDLNVGDKLISFGETMPSMRACVLGIAMVPLSLCQPENALDNSQAVSYTHLTLPTICSV